MSSDRSDVRHGMLPGSHERANGPECRCGAEWSRWHDCCTADLPHQIADAQAEYDAAWVAVGAAQDNADMAATKLTKLEALRDAMSREQHHG